MPQVIGILYVYCTHCGLPITRNVAFPHTYFWQHSASGTRACPGLRGTFAASGTEETS